LDSFFDNTLNPVIKKFYDKIHDSDSEEYSFKYDLKNEINETFQKI
jgi:hypothetical protein